MAELIDQLAQRSDMVLLKTSPVLAASDAAVLSRSADGVILVLQQKSSTEDHLHRALRQLEATRARILGLVLIQPRGQRSS